MFTKKCKNTNRRLQDKPIRVQHILQWQLKLID